MEILGIAQGVIATAITGLVVWVYSYVKKIIFSRKSYLRHIQSIKKRKEAINQSKKYIQELEIKKSPFLKKFKWPDLYLLLDKDISLLTFSNLRELSRRDLLAIYDGKIFIPNKSYLFFKHLRQPKSVLLFLAFTIIFIANILNIAWEQGHIVNLIAPSWKEGHFIISLALFILMVLFEIANIYRFDDIISVNLIQQSDDKVNNEILISDNFENNLRKYKVYQLYNYQNRKINRV